MIENNRIGKNEIEEKNIKIVLRSFETLNTGEVTKVSEFIHPNYFNHESQASPERAKLRGPEEFIDTVIFFLVVNTIIIPFEENRLQKNFGIEYERYKGLVRRWL